MMGNIFSDQYKILIASLAVPFVKMSYKMCFFNHIFVDLDLWLISSKSLSFAHTLPSNIYAVWPLDQAYQHI